MIERRLKSDQVDTDILDIFKKGWFVDTAKLESRIGAAKATSLEKHGRPTIKSQIKTEIKAERL